MSEIVITEDQPIALQVEPAQVIEAVSPTATVERVEGGAELTVHDLTGTTTAALYDGAPGTNGIDGKDGADGAPGADGHSPVVTASKSGSVTTISVDGSAIATISDGADGTDGKDGKDGSDGFSPSASVSKADGTATITITDKDGTTTATVSDGINGTNGQDGVSPTASVSKSGGTATISITDKDGTTTAEISDGDDYVLTAQDKQDIADLAFATVAVSGSTPVIVAAANHRYVCGTVSTIGFTPSESGLCDVLFRSGTSAAVLTVPSTVKWPEWFDPTSLAASTIYELNVIDGIYGAVMAWAD